MPDKRKQYKTKDEMSETDKFRVMLAKTATPTPTSDTPRYLLTVVAVLVLGIGGFALILWLRPEYDPLLVAGIIFAFLTPTTTSLLSFIKAEEAKAQAVETHLSVNSRLDAFIKQAESSARNEGREEGRERANARTDALAEAKPAERPAAKPKPSAVEPEPGTLTGTITGGTITGTIEEPKE